MTFDELRKIGLKLPGAEESRYYRMPALKVDGEIFFVCTSHPSAEPNSVSVPIGFKRRAERIARDPSVFYLKSGGTTAVSSQINQPNNGTGQRPSLQ